MDDIEKTAQGQALEEALRVLEGRAHDYEIKVPTTDDELWNLTKRYCGIEIPRTKVCENHVAPFTAFADAYFARSSTAIWEASRGFGGKTIMLAVLAFMEAVTLGAFVNLLGGSGEQSKRVHAYMRGDDPNVLDTFWGCPLAPRQLLKEDPTTFLTKLKHGGVIRVLAASQKSVRGPHPQRLRVDEIDECDLEILDAALPQPMEAKGIREHTVLSSTHQNPDGTMTEMKRRAPGNGWPIFTWCYRESLATHGGWLSPDSVERKKKDITDQMWLVEYENQEPSPESRAILPDAVERMFEGDIIPSFPGETLFIEPRMAICPKGHERPWSEYTWNEQVLDEHHKPKFYPNGKPVMKKVTTPCPECGSLRAKSGTYSTGGDWARKRDWTVILTFRTDVVPYRLVAFHRTQRQSWPTMVEALDEQIEHYDSFACHDATGLGDVVADYLRNPVEDVIMVGRTRRDMLSNFIASIERDEIRAPRIEFMYNQYRYASVDDLFGQGHLPDSLSAGSLAYMAFGYSGSLIAVI